MSVCDGGGGVPAGVEAAVAENDPWKEAVLNTEEPLRANFGGCRAVAMSTDSENNRDFGRLNFGSVNITSK